MKKHSPTKDWQTCRCGKHGWLDRSAAKKVRRRVDPSALMSVYRCTISGLWHFGHAPEALRQGRIARSEVEGPHHRVTDQDPLGGAA